MADWLAEVGNSVAIRAERLPQETTSSVAGAIWGPHLVERGDRVSRWSHQTLTTLTDLAGDVASGVRLLSGVEARRPPRGFPHCGHLLPNLIPSHPANPPDLSEAA